MPYILIESADPEIQLNLEGGDYSAVGYTHDALPFQIIASGIAPTKARAVYSFINQHIIPMVDEYAESLQASSDSTERAGVTESFINRMESKIEHDLHGNFTLAIAVVHTDAQGYRCSGFGAKGVDIVVNSRSGRQSLVAQAEQWSLFTRPVSPGDKVGSYAGPDNTHKALEQSVPDEVEQTRLAEAIYTDYLEKVGTSGSSKRSREAPVQGVIQDISQALRAALSNQKDLVHYVSGSKALATVVALQAAGDLVQEVSLLQRLKAELSHLKIDGKIDTQIDHAIYVLAKEVLREHICAMQDPCLGELKTAATAVYGAVAKRDRYSQYSRVAKADNDAPLLSKVLMATYSLTRGLPTDLFSEEEDIAAYEQEIADYAQLAECLALQAKADWSLLGTAMQALGSLLITLAKFTPFPSVKTHLHHKGQQLITRFTLPEKEVAEKVFQLIDVLRAREECEQGMLFQKSSNPEAEEACYKRAHTLGCQEGTRRLGLFFLYKKYAPESLEEANSNKKEAYNLLLKAAEKGYSPAMFDLGNLLAEKNKGKALVWYQKAAAAGHTEAQRKCVELRSDLFRRRG